MVKGHSGRATKGTCGRSHALSAMPVGSDLADSFCFAILFYTLVIYNASTIALSGQKRHSTQEPVLKRKRIA